MKRSGILALALGAVLETACLEVQIARTSDPGPAFRQARAEARRLQGRPGPAHELKVLVYDPHDREMVRVCVPMWLVRKIEGKVDWDDDIDFDGGERLKRRIKPHLRMKDIEKAGLGILVEVEEDDGSQVLVWLR